MAYCRSNGPRVASLEPPSFSRLWAGFAPRNLILKRRLPVADWLNDRLSEDGQAPTDDTKTGRLLADGLQRGRRLAGGHPASLESAPSSRGQDRVRLQRSSSPPNLGLDMAAVPRTRGDLRTAQHCCHSLLDVTPDRRSPVPHDDLSVQLVGGGPYQAARARKMAEARPAGPEGGQPPAGGQFLPRDPWTINQIRHGVATVISH